MLSEWPSETEAAAILGTSVKTINRYAEKKLIEIRKRPRLGKKPENVCNPSDIEKLKASAHVMPETSSALVAANGANGIARQAADMPSFVPLVPVFGALMQTIQTAITTFGQEAIDAKNLNEKLVLTLKEATRSGFSMAFLRRAVDNGTLKSFRDGRTIKIAREDLRALARQ